MVKLRFPSCVILLSALALVGLTLVFLSVLPAQADVGVQPILPGGGSIEPQVDTPIRMASEVVTMDVRVATAADNAILQLNPTAYGLTFRLIWYPAVAEVQADFTMHNPTTSTIALTTWFPLASALESVDWDLNPDEIVPRISSFQVQINQVPVEYSVQELPNPKGTDKPPLPWASFLVTFPANSDTPIHISYLLPLTQAIKGTEHALYYIFQTGSGWAGSIGHAELVLNLPYPASAETLARIPATSLGLPYSMADPRAVIPFDGAANANQARWSWTDFEPTAQDNFSVWLVNPSLWQDLQNARLSAQSNPQDGQVWLILANRYRDLAVKAYNFPSIFSSSYIPPGLEAYQKAAELLPDHPGPHIGIALLTLAPYMRDLSAPSEVLNTVQSELQHARDLESAHPDLANEADLSAGMVDDALSIYFGNATATAEAVLNGSDVAVQASTQSALLASATSSPPLVLTPTLMPSPSALPSSLASISAEDINSGSGSANIGFLLITSAVFTAVLLIAVILVLRRSSKKS